MIRHLPQPYSLLALFIVPVILWALIAGDAADIHLNDTYFVIGPYVLSRALSILLAAEAMLYFITRSFRQSKLLQRIHVYTTAIALACIFFLLAGGGNSAQVRFYDYGNPGNTTLVFTTIIMLALLAGHVAFVFNLIVGFVRGKKAPL